jgi:predicted MFS family arabinose efflux permease
LAVALPLPVVSLFVTHVQDVAYGAAAPVAGLLADHAGHADVFMPGSIAAATGFAIALVQRRR